MLDAEKQVLYLGIEHLLKATESRINCIEWVDIVKAVCLIVPLKATHKCVQSFQWMHTAVCLLGFPNKLPHPVC